VSFGFLVNEIWVLMAGQRQPNIDPDTLYRYGAALGFRWGVDSTYKQMVGFASTNDDSSATL
jgi:hypothetical protein